MSSSNVIRQVHSAVPGRIRYAIPELHARPTLVETCERQLRRAPGVEDARANPRSATLLILFNPAQPRTEWQRVLAEVLDVPLRSLDQPPEQPSESVEAQLGTQAAERVLARFDAARARLRTLWQHARTPSQQRADVSRETPQDPSQPCWHTSATRDLHEYLGTSERGLSAQESQARLDRDGRNEIEAAKQRSSLRIALDQFSSTPVAMLGASALLSAVTGSFLDSGAILLVVGVNAAIGFGMERGAERTIAALAQPIEHNASVLRDGRPCEIPVPEVVAGDVLLLQAGVLVAADARLLQVEGLMLDESSLTGESEPAAKSIEPIEDARTPLGSRHNMVYRGTLVAAGSGKAIVVATGPRTELGQIHSLAGGLQAGRTPLQQQLDRLGRQLVIGAGSACAAVLGVGLLRGQAPVTLLRTAVSLGVAAVPEGLPTVALATLARGVSRMRSEHVVVRRLSAVETLGATQVLCVDKTGTLTRNRMTVVALQAGLRRHEVRDGMIVGGQPAEVEALLRVGVINSEVVLEEKSGELTLEGSSTERALVQLALDGGVDVKALRVQYPVCASQPRIENRHYVTTLHRTDGGEFSAVKGSPEEVLALCTQILHDGQTRELTDDDRASISRENERMAAQPLRVLGCAHLERGCDVDQPQDLVWLGLIGMEDPPRKGVAEVLACFREAGVRTIMMTGDQGSTAEGVGRQVGLGTNGRLEVVDATELESLEPERVRELVTRADVFARVSPAHKLNLVRALQAAGFVTAMTGDGVNDSPALKAAEIGIAMGASGANAAREVADLVLEDDELRRLVFAMREGRTIYGDIRNAVRFILATNSSEILFTFACVASGLGEGLSPLQLLWINIITDIFPELALAVQPPESDVLARPPRDPKRPMFDRRDLTRAGVEGAAIALGALGAQLGGSKGSGVGFTTLVFAQLLHALCARSEERGLFDREKIPANHWLELTLAGSATVQLAITLFPPLRALFGMAPLTAADWARVAMGSTLPLLFNDGMKAATSGMRSRPA